MVYVIFSGTRPVNDLSSADFFSQLFNAASLREAVNARTLNLFVIVFTVVTVIYTPLGFLAVSQDAKCVLRTA